MPVLLATSVSMFAERCLNCFQALIKKSRPSQNTTGVDNIHKRYPAPGKSMKNILMTEIGTARTMAQVARNFSCRNLRLCASSASCEAFSSCAVMTRSYPAFCMAVRKASGEHVPESYSTVAVAAA